MSDEVQEKIDGLWQLRTCDGGGTPSVAHVGGRETRQAANEYAARSEAEDWLTFRAVLHSLQTP